jgi:uncharacterized protein HemY
MVYLSSGLLTEAIHFLDTQIRSRSGEPVLHRLLGDCYTEAGLLTVAQQHYQIAKALAQTADDSVELAKAQTALLMLNETNDLQPASY